MQLKRFIKIRNNTGLMPLQKEQWMTKLENCKNIGLNSCSPEWREKEEQEGHLQAKFAWPTINSLKHDVA